MCRIIFHLFRFYYAKMRRKLWRMAPAKEGAMGQMSKNFQVYFRNINFFKKPNKKKLQYSQRVILRCYYICFLILYCQLAQKKEAEKWPKAADSPLLTHLIEIFFQNSFLKENINLDCSLSIFTFFCVKVEVFKEVFKVVRERRRIFCGSLSEALDIIDISYIEINIW